MRPDGLPVVAVVGRQNVGKSTLVNRLLGRREAIADERPGVTRDRVEVEAGWGGRRFVLVDTGGHLHGARGIEALVARQAERAADEADVVVLVVDATTGPVEEDASLARRLRRSPLPVLLVANKVDSERDEADAAGFVRLGLGEPAPVSALHGRGAGDLLDRLVAVLPEAQEHELARTREPRFALVGRPNVGKSSLFNRLVGHERSVVFEEAGTTRDAVDAVADLGGERVRFVDTAGFRRPSRAQGVDYYSFLRTERAIERSDVAILVIDASDGFTTEDRRIAARVIEEGRGLAIVANKWDLIEHRDAAYRALALEAAPFARAPVHRTSALRGSGVDRLPRILVALHRRWGSRVPTAAVNALLEHVEGERPPPGRARYRYATQVASGPPVFVLFGGAAPGRAYERFIENRFRAAFDLDGVPIRLRFRARRDRHDR